MAKKKPDENGKTKKTASKKTPSPAKTIAKKTLRIKRSFPVGQQPVFSNHLAVQHDGATFYLLFFHIRQPLIIGDDEASHKELAALTELNAECVAQVVVPPQLIPAIIKALAENFQKREAVAAGSIEVIDLGNQPGAGA
jgi:hypothetical protein